MNESPELPQNSEITGAMSLGSAVARSLGQARGGIIADGSRTGSAALAKLTPQETNARMEACLQRISGQRPVLGRRMMFPANGPAYSITESASWKCTTESQRNEALAAVEFALRPADEMDIGKALYTLRMMTRGRDQRSDADREAEALIWQEHLRLFPADIVLVTLKNWPHRPDGQWWPTWHDVQKELEAQTSGRRLLADHIRKSECLPPPAKDFEPDDSPEALARRKAQADAARERFGIKSSTGETVVDREAMPEALRAERDKEVAKAAAKLREGSYRLSDEAMAIFRDGLSDRVVPSPDEQFDTWNREAAE
jgi:hypothetical protein